MPATTDLIPGTTGSYDYHWKRTLELLGQLIQALTKDSVPAPSVGEDGEPLTPEEIQTNPTWYFLNYVRETLEELRLFRKEVRDAHTAEVARDAAVQQAVRDTLTSAVPALAAAIAAEIEPGGDVQAAVEAGVRNVLRSGVGAA